MARGTYIRTRYRESASKAFASAIDAYNCVSGKYRKEQSLILMTNAIECLAKAVLLKSGKRIERSGKSKNETIPCDIALTRLVEIKEISEIENQSLQQVVSLRDAATHSYLPDVPDEIMQHLMYCSVKTFIRLDKEHFSSNGLEVNDQILTLSIGSDLTYADRVEGLLKSYKRTKDSDTGRLAYLLEKGAAFQGDRFQSQAQFESKFLRSGKPILDRVKLGNYIKNSDQYRFVLFQAPKGYTVDVDLRRGSSKQKTSLPVVVRKTNLDVDYPYLTAELAEKLGKSQSYIAHTIKNIGLKNDERYHQSIRAGRGGNTIQKYSEAALQKLKEYLQTNPTYNPYK